ncbi:3-oxoacyl-(acyl-carrier protein) reductase [Vibrio ishigakensis]|uniref:3-oxoacyl-(Acyl-carrier protein) reductase n=1 Tax=Vibrio ishigakensis TaxID=1481914 RepID=A0A0B8QMP8_9VIBR|nr:3-oxoacyl-(acyl-carrier protein) reductase [Vibrio ishigakensis]
MELNLANKNVVITGGSNGIGAEIVRTFAQEGANVWFCARNQLRIDKMCSSLGEKVQGQSVDILDTNAFSRWIDSIPRIDIFVANVSPISDDWSEMVETDILGTQKSIELVIPKLLHSRSAAITYIGSKASSVTIAGANAYGAGKAAMAHYMKSLSLTYASKIRVNTVSPGDTYVEDGFWGKFKRENPQDFKQVIQRNPLGRLAKPEEVARVVTFISSPAASFVSGSNWYVDGTSTNHIQY